VTNAPFAFEREPYRTELPTHVVLTGSDGPLPFVVLEETIFYPEGGGQPADHGEIAGETVAAVVDVQKREGAIRHYLDRPLAAGPVTARIDWGRRFDHMQQHTGQHLLTAVAADRFHWETTAFHLGAEVSDIELGSAPLAGADLAALEEAVAAEIRAARPITARRVDEPELAALPVRTRGLPDGHSGDIRLVEIAGVDLNTCGGTHLGTTAEIEALKLLGTEAIRGGTRLFFAAGGRARRRFGAHEARNASLRTLLGAPDGGLVAAAEAKLDQLQESLRRARGLEEELIAALVSSVATTPGPTFVRHFDGKGGDFLQRLARQLASLAPGKAVLVTASAEGQHLFAIGFGELLDVDAHRASKEIIAAIGGRGGGSGRVFQGKAPSLEGLANAVEILERTTGGV
jgi:alanyl-tRNA synthetase